MTAWLVLRFEFPEFKQSCSLGPREVPSAAQGDSEVAVRTHHRRSRIPSWFIPPESPVKWPAPAILLIETTR